MSLESQLERICVALEIIAGREVLAGKSIPALSSDKIATAKLTAEGDPPKVLPKVETPKTEAKPKAEPKAPTSTEGKVTLEDLAEKVKTLAGLGGRDAVLAVFEGFNVLRLTELLTEQYVLADLALTKAITKTQKPEGE